MITTDRDVFVGAHTTPEVKDALRAEARKRRTSISRLVHLEMLENLKRLGYPLTDEQEQDEE